MNIRYVRLSDGEEVLAEFTETDDHVCLTNPLQVDYGEINETKYAFLSRWNPFSNRDVVKIPKNHVFCHTDVKPEVAEYYIMSLEYAETISDPIFTKRLIDAKLLIHQWSMPDPEDGDMEEGLNPSGKTTFH